MAKLQEPKKAIKKEKFVKVKNAVLSEDRVVDSDSESEQKAPKAAVKAVEKEKENKTKTKTKTKTAPKTAPKKAVTPPPPPSPPVEVEKSDDEDDDDEDSDDLDGDDESTASEKEEVTKSTTVNGVKRKADEASNSSSSSEEGSSSDENLADVQPAAKKTKTLESQPKKTKAASPTESEEEVRSKTAPPPSIPVQSFVAPKNFAPVDSTKSHSVLPSDLQGKQIWHIIAPSSLPISEIKTVGVDAITSGSTVLTHKGSEYALSKDTSTTRTTLSVFLPRKEGYKAADMPIAQTLKLQQKVVLPKLSVKQARTETGSEAAADVWKTATVDGDGPRPQPKGMRMRYKPPGFGLGDPGLGSDDDEEEEGFRLPKAKTMKKGRRESGEAMEGVETTGKELSKEEKKRAKKEAKAKLAAGSK